MSAVSDHTIHSLQQQFGGRMLIDEPLSRYTSVGIGGPADVLLMAGNETELEQMASACWQADLPTLILGKGSNVLVSDKGIRGVTIINRAEAVSITEDPSSGAMTRLFAESGALLAKAARVAEQHSLSGMEWAEGVPGTVGGAVIGNAGAFGGDIAMNIITARMMQRGEQPRDYQPDEMGFAYRKSFLKNNTINHVVLSAIFQLAPGDRDQIHVKMQENQEKRRKKQPATRSIGSVFKNPENGFAGRLINQLGMKGTRVGDAMISMEHANIFINVGQATAQEWVALMELTQKAVFEHHGILLEPEILKIGEW